ncbi:MAG TPA: hypothetical protein VM658_19560 [bacterium]|nr:hypothetical protein [bacterium]
MTPTPHEEIKAIAERIVRETSGILDRQQRVYAIGKKLSRLNAETILEIFRIISHGARFKEPLFLDGFRDISDVKKLGKHVGYDKMAEVYALARSKDYRDIVRLMQVIPAARKLGTDEELEEDPVLKEMTLGTKRQKARLRDRDMISRLCHEQDPTVIRNLLLNPAVTLQHVVRIASKRPTSAQVLWVVYRDLKWMNHYVVKKTLINNPYTPTQISLSQLHFLLEQDLEDVAENQMLHPLVREAAVELIMLKRESTGQLPPKE